MAKIKDVAKNFKDNDLPVDTMWSDIDYMVDYIDFTLDANRYPPEEFRNFLKDYSLRFVPIIDAGIAIGDNRGFKVGFERDVFIKNAWG